MSPHEVKVSNGSKKKQSWKRKNIRDGLTNNITLSKGEWNIREKGIE